MVAGKSDPQRLNIQTEPHFVEAIKSVSGLLIRLRVEHVFVGGLATSAWLGEPFEGGSVDVLAAVSPEGKTQIPMMASQRGFLVDRDELEAAEELDLIPLRFSVAGRMVRVHVLVASNALYGNMFRTAVESDVGDQALIRVPSAEDLALLLTVSGDDHSHRSRTQLILKAGGSFDRERFNQKLFSIGLSGEMI